MVHVRLSPMDFGNMRFRSAMEAMAKFLCSHVEYWENFCDIICESYSWSLETYKSELKDWLDVIRKRRCKGSADDEYIERIERLFHLCRKPADINDMRGLAPEYVFYWICKTQAGEERWSIVQGCSVSLDQKMVQCAHEDASKKTVDLGAWHFQWQYGVFAEIKVSPYSFQEIDARYLLVLREMLQDCDGVHYHICLFSLEEEGFMETKAEQAGFTIAEDTVVLHRNDIFSVNPLQARENACLRLKR